MFGQIENLVERLRFEKKLFNWFFFRIDFIQMYSYMDEKQRTKQLSNPYNSPGLVGPRW